MTTPSPALRALRLVAWMACGALAYGFFVLAYLVAYQWDLEEQRARADRKAELLEIEARNFEVTERKRPEFLEEARTLEAKLSVLNRILPPDPLPEIVVLNFTRLARRTGVALVEATPGAAQMRRGRSHLVLPWTIKIRGGLAELEAFVARLPRLPRLFQVRTLALEGAGAASYLATLALETFQHVREDARTHDETAKPCERDEAALYSASDVVARVELVNEERTEVPGAVEIVKHYRVSDVRKGTLQPGGTVDVTRTCVARSAPLAADGYPFPVERCTETAAQPAGAARVLYAQAFSGAPAGPFWETPRFGGAPLACRVR